MTIHVYQGNKIGFETNLSQFKNYTIGDINGCEARLPVALGSGEARPGVRFFGRIEARER